MEANLETAVDTYRPNLSTITLPFLVAIFVTFVFRDISHAIGSKACRRSTAGIVASQDSASSDHVVVF